MHRPTTLRRAASSWFDEQECVELLDRLVAPGPFDEMSFVHAVGRAAGGAVTVARLPDEVWETLRASLGGHVSGITTPYPGGWAILLPASPVAAETTVLGHEAAHIVFGDVPHWDACTSSVRSATLVGLSGTSPAATHALPRLAARVRLGLRHEARAERLGALLTARIEIGGRGESPVDHVDKFFKVGEV